MSFVVINRPITTLVDKGQNVCLAPLKCVTIPFGEDYQKKHLYMINNICWTDDVIDRKINAKKDKQIN